MSSKWFVESEKERITLDEGSEEEQWVDIKSKLSIADQDHLGQLLMEIKIDTSNSNGIPRAERRRLAKEGKTMDAQFKPSTVALLQVSIVDWSFVDSKFIVCNPNSDRAGNFKSYCSICLGNIGIIFGNSGCGVDKV